MGAGWAKDALNSNKELETAGSSEDVCQVKKSLNRNGYMSVGAGRSWQNAELNDGDKVNSCTKHSTS